MESLTTSPSRISHGIRISVQSVFVPEQSSAADGHFLFAYRIHIHNGTASTVQLLRRQWSIYDGEGNRRVVVGDGVIGKQPVLSPGQQFQYTSGSNSPTPIGKMEGHYVFVDQDLEQEFTVEIPPFLLIAPFLLN
jgi:ApaG protein